jgi:hypothetical protein
MAPYAQILTFVQHLSPTWRQPQQVTLAQLVAALLERPGLCLTNLARALPAASQPLHGRLKRLGRWLDNPRLDELALSARFLKLSYRFGADVPDQPAGPGARPLHPILLDTTYFEPFAALIAAVPCGARALPIAFTTYHRRALRACFPPAKFWPQPGRQPSGPAAAVPRAFPSQNRIEQQLIELVFRLLSPALRGVLVADRGFARAALFAWLQGEQRDFVIRFAADTWVYLDPAGPGQPARDALALAPGERRWHVGGAYQQQERVPVNLLAVWDAGQQEPWYLATTLDRADWTEQLYRWRMRIECGNRDEKTGVLLREGGDAHALRSVLHLHRLLLAVCTAQWLCALAGLQAHRDLALAPGSDALERAAPPDPDLELIAQGPAAPPPAVPHRGPGLRLPGWMRRFATRGPLSYVRLGREVLRAPDLRWLVRRAVHWLGLYLWTRTPHWRPHQLRYRLRHWWRDPA